MLTLFHFYVSHQDCDSPPVIAHGHHKLISSFLGLKSGDAIYECDEGYTLVGKNKLSCTSSGWSPAAPQCKGNSSSLFSFVGGELSWKAWEHSFFSVRGSKKIFDSIWFILNTYYILMVPKAKSTEGTTETLISPTSFSQVQNSASVRQPLFLVSCILPEIFYRWYILSECSCGP